MTRVKSLAASQRRLAEVLIDALRAETKSAPKSLAGSHGNAGQKQLDLRFDDADEFDPDDTAKILRPDDAAAAILLGRALDRDRAALAKLQNSDVITIVEVPSTDYVGLVARLIKEHLIGDDAPVLEDKSLPNDDRLGDAGTVVIFRRVDEGKTKKSTPDNGNLAAAIQLRCAIVGIAADPDRLLPADLVCLAEHRIIVPPLDGAAIGAVIEAVTGRGPGTVDDELARRVSLEQLMIAVRADLGAERSLARLVHLLDHKAANAERAPRLSELHGLGPARDWGLALAQDLQDYAAGRLPWTAVARGCVLSGPPGTGKTSFARALAREAGVYFVATSYGQWQAHKDGHLGSVTQAIRGVFADAAKQVPAILFVDEIDTIPARGSTNRHDDWWTAITNTLLECLDGFERREGVVVIAACNDPSRLDPALVRAGRLDRHIRIPLPDIPALIGILRTHLGGDLEGVDLRAAALAARGHTGADVERWVRDARRKARIGNRDLTLQDLLEAIREGEPEWPADVRRRIAYHEAGHAVAMLAVGLAVPKSLSIGGMGGMAESERNEMGSLTRAYIEDHLVVLLGGRAGEELVFGEGTAGAGGSQSSDLARATKLATELETAFGLGSYGLVCVGDERAAHDLLLLEHLRTAVRRSLDQAYATALDLLAKHRATLDALADALFTGGYLDQEEIRAVLAKAPLKMTDTTAVPPLQPSPPLEADDTGAGPAADESAAVTTIAP